MATYIGLFASVPSYALSSSCVNGSSLGGSKSSRSGCMIFLFAVLLVTVVLDVVRRQGRGRTRGGKASARVSP